MTNKPQLHSFVCTRTRDILQFRFFQCLSLIFNVSIFCRVFGTVSFQHNFYNFVIDLFRTVLSANHRERLNVDFNLRDQPWSQFSGACNWRVPSNCDRWTIADNTIRRCDLLDQWKTASAAQN